MDSDEAIEVIEKILLHRPLNSTEKFVLSQAWDGQTYTEMARSCGYGSAYMKEIGSQLWLNLSEVLGERVTKKNLHLVIKDHQQNRAAHQQLRLEQKIPTNRRVENVLDSAMPSETELAHSSRRKLHSCAEVAPVKEEACCGGSAGELDSSLQLPLNPPRCGDHQTGVLSFEFPQGPLPINSSLYINRPPVEELAYSELSQPGCMIRIRAPRKMGKSSLLNRVIAHARAQKYETVYLDLLQEADQATFKSIDKLLRWLCINASRQLNFAPQLEEYWDEEMGSKVSCKLYFERYLLKQVDHPILLVVNEVNRVFEYPDVAQDFLTMLRSWHERAKQIEIWQKLRLVLVELTEAYVPLKLNQSPFNVGLTIRLPPFTLEQVQDLAQRYRLNWARGQEGAQQLAPLVGMVGGHPYLVNVALYHLCQQTMSLAKLLQFASTSTGIYGKHLRNLLALLRQDAELASALQRVVAVEEGVQLEAITAHKLESLGLVQLYGDQAKPSCELYRLYFQQQLVEKHQLPGFVQSDNTNAGRIDINNKGWFTQLADWRSFNTHLEINWQQWTRDMLVLSLILCDIDYFKFYNDAHGQSAGDDCIRKIAHTIHDCVRHQVMLVARCGETKFAAVLPYTDASTAVETAELIREQVKSLGLTHDQSKIGGFPSQFVTVSVGVVSTKLDAHSSPATLIADAEAALSKAKRQGRDRVTSSQ